METPFIAASYRTYAEIIRDASTQRRLLRVGREIERMIAQREGETSRMLRDAETLIYELSGKGVRGDFTRADKLVIKGLERLTAAEESGGGVVGVPTGFLDLDNVIGGLQAGNMVVVAARPSMGKTALALGIAEHAALQKNLAVAVFSLEMSGDELDPAPAVLHRRRRRRPHPRRPPRARGLVAHRPRRRPPVGRPAVHRRLGGRHRRRDAHQAAPPQEPRRPGPAGRGLHPAHGGQPHRRDENRVQEISDISRSLKMLARDLEVPIICVSQLNRAPDARNDKRPMLSDLRESGAIEQDADLVLMIYRDDYYNPDSEEKGVAEVLVAKNRHGPTDRVKLTFRGSYAKFDNLARDNWGSGCPRRGDRRPVGRRGQGQGRGPAGRAQRPGRALPGRQQRRPHDRGRRADVRAAPGARGDPATPARSA